MQTQCWDKENRLMHLDVLADKPRLEHCEDQYGTKICSRPVQRHNYGAQINPTLLSMKEYTVELVRTHIPLVHFFKF